MLQSPDFSVGGSMAGAAAQSHLRLLLFKTADPCWPLLQSSSALHPALGQEEWQKGCSTHRNPPSHCGNWTAHPRAPVAAQWWRLSRVCWLEIVAHYYSLCPTTSAWLDPAKAPRTTALLGSRNATSGTQGNARWWCTKSNPLRAHNEIRAGKWSCRARLL